MTLTINTSLLFAKKQFFTFFVQKKVVVVVVVLLLLLTSPNNKIESEMAYNTTATLDKLACTEYVDFGKHQDRSGQVSWAKKSFLYSDVKLKVFKKDENKEFRLAQNLTMGEADLNQLIRLRNHLVIAFRDFSKEENLPHVRVKQAKDMEEQLKLTHKEIRTQSCCTNNTKIFSQKTA